MGREGRGGEGGSIDTQLWKLSNLRWGGGGGEGRGGGSIDTQLWKLSNLRWGGRRGEGRGVDRHSLWNWSWDYLADPGWIDTDPGGVDQHSTLKVKLRLPWGSGVDRHWSWGVNRRSPWKWSWDYLVDPGWIDTDPGGVYWHSLWKWSWDYLADPGWIDTDPGGSIDTHFESEVEITLRIRGGSTLILGGSIDNHFESEVEITLRIRGGSTLILGGGQLTLTLKVKLRLPCRSGVDRHWSWGGSINTHFESEVEITLQIRGGSTLILGGSIDTHFETEVEITLWIRGGSTLILGGGRSTLNLERIRKDFGRIASNNVNPGGGYLSAPDIPCAARVGH